MIYNLDGLPEPPSDIVRRLEAVDPSLGMTFITGMDDGSGSCWGITQRWSPNDPRRRHILSGDWDPRADYDIVCFIPPDCSTQDAFGYFARSIRRSGKDDVRKMADRLGQWNNEQKERNWEPAMAGALDFAEKHVSTLFEKEKGKIAKSSGAGARKATKARKGRRRSS